MEQAELDRLLHCYRQGSCTPAEVRLVEQWYDALGQDREALRLSPAEQETLRAALWQRIEGQVSSPAPTLPPVMQVVRPASRWKQWTAAAAVVAGVGLGALLLHQPELAPEPTTAAVVSEWVTQRNATTQAMQVKLADGSVVQLAAASSLRYPRHFRGARRQVSLTGEAFFEVSHDAAHPFQVYTEQVVTTVLGTSFTVRAFAGQAQAQVVVRTGKVRVTPRRRATQSATAQLASVVVLPNQQVTYSAATPELRAELVAQPVVLTNQSFTFDDRPVTEVLAALEKAYNVTFEYDKAALSSCSVTLTLRSPSLRGKLDTLCKILKGSYEVVGTRIKLTAKGCSKG